jgi:hypothetical protein
MQPLLKYAMASGDREVCPESDSWTRSFPVILEQSRNLSGAHGV